MAELKEYIVNYLVDKVGDSIWGRGAEASRVNKLVEAQIGRLFERYITGKDGDKIDRYFLVDEGGILYIFNGSNFERITNENTLKYLIKLTMEKSNVGAVYQYNSSKKIADECEISIKQEKECKFIPDRRYAVFNNVVLDIETGKLSPHSVKYVTDMVFDFDYDPDKRFPFWEQFVEKTIPDEEMRKAFQQFCGAFFVNRSKVKIEHICILVGSGQNGKSVLAEAIVGMFGGNLVTKYSPEQLFKSSQRDYALADVHGKLANYCDDISNKDFSGGDFKLFTSGAPFQGRHPYGSYFIVTKIPLMLCCANAMPPTTDDTDGYYRRLLPIMCPNQVADKDKDPLLKDKLATPEARVGIFNWLLDGYHELIANNGKIEIGSSIKEVKDTIKAEANSARRWVKEMGFIAINPIDAQPSNWKSFADWMRIYKEYCNEYNESAKSPKAVGLIFKEMGFASERRSSGTWYCVGVKEDSEFREKAIPEEDLPF